MTEKEIYDFFSEFESLLTPELIDLIECTKMVEIESAKIDELELKKFYIYTDNTRVANGI